MKVLLEVGDGHSDDIAMMITSHQFHRVVDVLYVPPYGYVADSLGVDVGEGDLPVFVTDSGDYYYLFNLDLEEIADLIHYHVRQLEKKAVNQ